MTTTRHASASRRHDFDALRAFAMLLGIVLHAALAFMPVPWIVQDPQPTQAAGLLIAVIHGFRMPLFFLMSGFFTAMLWQRRGVAAMLRQRVLRVLVPCLLGLVTVLPAGQWVATRCLELSQQQDAAGLKPPTHHSPLTAAVLAGDSDLVRSLLAENAPAGAATSNDTAESPVPLLTLAAACGHLDIVRQLLDDGEDPNVLDPGRQTPLHTASFFGQPAIAALLLDYGANPLATGPFGNTPFSSTQVDANTTTLLARMLGLPLPDMKRIQQGREQVRQLLTDDHTADQPGQREHAVASPHPAHPLAAARRSYTNWLVDERFVVPFPPYGHSRNLFTARVFDHLWFLWYLCWLVIMLVAAGTLAQWLRIPAPPRWLIVSPGALLWLVPLSLVPQLFMGLFRPSFGPDSPFGVLPVPHVLAMHAIFFGYGALLYQARDAGDAVGKHWALMLVIALAVCLPAGLATMAIPAWTAVPQVLYAWLMSFGLIGLFRHLLSFESTAVRYVSDSAYWLYLIHFPVLVTIQTWLRPLSAPPLLKLGLECALATIVMLVSYQLFVRHTPIGLLLNGKRMPRSG